MDQGSPEAIYAVYWLYKTAPERRRLKRSEREQLGEEFARTLEERAGTLTLRGAYSLVGLRHDADLMLWLHGPDLAAAQDLAVALRKTGLGAYLENVYAYTGIVPVSRYAPEHRPAFTKGAPPRGYLSVYPFVKTPEWYLLPFEQRRALMAEHGRMGQRHSAMPEVTIRDETGRPVGAGAYDQRSPVGISEGSPGRPDGATGDGQDSVTETRGAAVAIAEAAPAPRGAVLANTVHSFGLGDQEFVVAFESDDPAAIEQMVEELRAAEVRRYTALDTPIFLGRRKSLRDALDDLG